jgi:hypothetical protein
VIHATSSQIVKFLGNLFDFRKANILPSTLLRANKNTAAKATVFKIRAASLNERN